jgi:hypothetical protein
MARTKKTVDPKTLEAEKTRISEYFDRISEPKQPIITCITINPNGTIFGLADNKIYVYDDFKHEWKVRS